MKYSLPSTHICLESGAQVWPFDLTGQDESLSLAVVEVDNLGHGGTMNKFSDRFYYILAGSGTFLIDKSEYVVVAGEVVRVKKGMAYDFWSDSKKPLRVLVVNSPAFDPTGEVAIRNLRQ